MAFHDFFLFQKSHPYFTIPTFNDLREKPSENVVGKGENAGNQHFLLFPQYFSPFPNQIAFFRSNLFCCL